MGRAPTACPRVRRGVVGPNAQRLIVTAMLLKAAVMAQVVAMVGQVDDEGVFRKPEPI